MRYFEVQNFDVMADLFDCTNLDYPVFDCSSIWRADTEQFVLFSLVFAKHRQSHHLLPFRLSIKKRIPSGHWTGCAGIAVDPPPVTTTWLLYLSSFFYCAQVVVLLRHAIRHFTVSIDTDFLRPRNDS